MDSIRSSTGRLELMDGSCDDDKVILRKGMAFIFNSNSIKKLYGKFYKELKCFLSLMMNLSFSQLNLAFLS